MNLVSTIEHVNLTTMFEILSKWTSPILQTMGAQGEVVIIGTENGNIYTQDGITVALNIAPPDPVARTIFRAVVDAAHQTVSKCGDGTTTTTCLVVEMIKALAKKSRGDRHELLDEIGKCVEMINEQIEKSAIQIKHVDQLINVATISCHGDEKLGKMIGDLVHQVGADGDVSIKGSPTGVSFTKYLNGYVSRSMMINSNFINQPATRRCEFVKPWLLIADENIDDSDTMIEILEAYRYWIKSDFLNNPLVIMCDDMQGGALNTAIANLPQMGRSDQPVPICVIKCPSSFQRRAELLEDMSAITSAKVFKKIGGIPVSSIGKSKTVNPFGRMEKITIDDKKSVFQLESDEASKAQIEKLRGLHEAAEEEEDRKYLNDRISRLSSGIGLIYVGGDSGAENTRTVHLVEDAVLASIQALKHGVVPGGGMALVRAALHLSNEKSLTGLHMDIINETCWAPARRIAGRYSKFLGKVPSHKMEVIDARTGQWVDSWVAGILDPASVPTTALSKAYSVVKQLALTTQFVITINEDND